MHDISYELDEMLDRLDPQTAGLLKQTVRDAVALAGQRLETVTSIDNLGYPVGYFEATAGGFEDEPLEGPADYSSSQHRRLFRCVG